jgi:hypothetical protein
VKAVCSLFFVCDRTGTGTGTCTGTGTGTEKIVPGNLLFYLSIYRFTGYLSSILAPLKFESVTTAAAAPSKIM